jgi:outer membrane biosynthesis protein TonB
MRSIDGIVRLKITITPKDDVKNVQLLGGNPILAESAAAAVEKWEIRSSLFPDNSG